MANAPQIPLAGLSALRSEPSLKQQTTSSLDTDHTTSEPTASQSTSLPVAGPRKLVRPQLPMSAQRVRSSMLHEEPAILAHQTMSLSASAGESTHAEAFYFQKQVQSQTPMVIVLEDGERIEGCIEWYDHNAIKVKNSSRMLIYKAAIKYIYKAGDSHS